MAVNEPGWELYRSFLAVLREGSLSGAARALHMTQPSLGRHIRQLEYALDAVLFIRSPRGFVPTELAHELGDHAQAMAAASAALRRAAVHNDALASGVVRLSCSEIVGAEVLPPILAAFHQQHAGVVIELSLSNRNENLLHKEADIAVRMVQPRQDALIARRIGNITVGLHAHRRYLKRRGQPASLDELRQHALIGFDQETPALRALRDRLPYGREDFALRSDSDLAQLAAIRAGFGIGVCQCALAARDRNLVRVLPTAFALDLDTWLVMHKDLRTSKHVRLLFDHLVPALGGYASES